MGKSSCVNWLTACIGYYLLFCSTGKSCRQSSRFILVCVCRVYTGRFIMFSVITNIYNKKTTGRTLMELVTATGKLKKFFFWQPEMFNVCITGDTAHMACPIRHPGNTVFRYLTVEVGRTSILLEYERRYVLQRLQHVQICHASNSFFVILEYIMKYPVYSVYLAVNIYFSVLVSVYSMFFMFNILRCALPMFTKQGTGYYSKNNLKTVWYH
jgi:hypothetical protein